ncbi:MAG TPA: MarR family transcriptional regulator [Rhodothermales bacterium]|nr:MarR family transcriptional regulator [Rhodothermales bacterium]HRR08213.1 MarR family transcriptional regulator [Rhodothermales bacterium]
MLYSAQDLYAPGQLAIDNLIATANWMMNELTKGLAPYQITLAQYKVLLYLYKQYPAHVMVSQIGENLIDRTPDVTRLLDRLEKQLWIARKRAEHDKRIVEVHLTDSGRDLVEAVQEPHDRIIDRLSGILSNAEHLLLIDYLERLRRAPL